MSRISAWIGRWWTAAWSLFIIILVLGWISDKAIGHHKAQTDLTKKKCNVIIDGMRHRYDQEKSW